MEIKMVLILIVYLIGVICCLYGGISYLKKEGGQVKDLFLIIVLALLSWITFLGF